MRILIVEDDPLLSRQLADTLARAGDAVDCASDGEAGHFLGDTEQTVTVKSGETVKLSVESNKK